MDVGHLEGDAFGLNAPDSHDLALPFTEIRYSLSVRNLVLLRVVSTGESRLQNAYALADFHWHD